MPLRSAAFVAIAVRQVDRLGVRAVAHTDRGQMIFLSQAKSRYVLICGDLAAPLKRSGAHRKTAPLSRALESCPATSQVAWLSKLTVNPLLNSAGRHAHEIRLRLADRNGIADLEFPFPQPRLYLGKAEFNTPAVHM